VNFLKHLNLEHANSPPPLAPNLVRIYNFYQKTRFFFVTTMSSWQKPEQGPQKKRGPKTNEEALTYWGNEKEAFLGFLK
jgi:hypothetical protein